MPIRRKKKRKKKKDNRMKEDEEEHTFAVRPAGAAVKMQANQRQVTLQIISVPEC